MLLLTPKGQGKEEQEQWVLKWGGEMAQQLKAHAAPVENPSSVPSIHIRPLTIAYNHSCREPDALFWPP